MLRESSGVPSACTKDLSILTMSTCSRSRCDRDEKPVPKSSSAMRMPSERSSARLSTVASLSVSISLSVISMTSEDGANPDSATSAAMRRERPGSTS